ncbi:MAG TPA: HEAT repeat domain-containing protein [Longimicrobiales bacterium]
MNRTKPSLYSWTLIAVVAAPGVAAPQDPVPVPVPPVPPVPPTAAVEAIPAVPALPDVEAALAAAAAIPWSASDLAAIAPALEAAGARLQAVEAGRIAPGLAGLAAELDGVSAAMAALPAALAGIPTDLAEARAGLARANAALARVDAERFRDAVHTLPLGAHGLTQAPARLPAAAWAPQDPADSLYRAAREALNGGDYARAAELFHRLVEQFPQSVYAPDALYWEAFARSRRGGEDELRKALEALDRQRTAYPDAPSRADADVLATRIRGELARQGDAEAAATVTKAATTPAAACTDADQDVRAAALNALLQMDADRALPILRQVLDRRDACSTPLRKKAVFLVAQKVTPETEDLLLDIAREDPSIEVRKQAVFWLSEVSTERAVAALEQILSSPDDAKLAEGALFALSQHHNPRAGEILRAYAERQDAPVDLRKKAIFWIGQRGDRDDAEFLRALYGRLDRTALKEGTLFALSQMHGVDNARWLLDVALDENESVEMRKKALFWASQAGTPIQDLLTLYDRISNRELKEHLIFVYVQRHESAAIDKLIEIARGESDLELRKKAIFWLGQSDDPRAGQVLMEIINHDD